MGIRVLFQCYGRRGLGHLMRGSNIAKALLDLAPDAEVIFYTRSFPPEGIRDDRFDYCLESDSQGMSSWRQLVESSRPDILVYDTMLPKQPDAEPLLRSAKRAYVMRRCKPTRHQAILDNPFLEHIDRILIPHDQDEFGYELPHEMAKLAVFVGSIVRPPSPTAVPSMREKYRVDPQAFLITSTPGGGGFGSDTDGFFDLVYRAHRQLVAKTSTIRHIVIQGPRNNRSMTVLDQMVIVPIEPRMVDLIAASDVVIAAGGYNTVNEIRACKTPAIFLPGSRTHDDQVERVSRLVKRGLGWVLRDRPPEDLAHQIAELCRSPTALYEVRGRYAQDTFHCGNHRAAHQIMSLVES